MNPIQLTAPDGTVYAYACGTCHHVRCATSRFVCVEPGHFADESHAEAARCCTCWTCGAPLPRGSGIWSSTECEACKARLQPERDARLDRIRREDAALDDENDRRLAACPDRMAAEHLVEVIREISEDTYCAGWLSGIESHLWSVRHKAGPVKYGMGTITPGDLDKLRALSNACDGWWTWVDRADERGAGPIFVRLDEWARIVGDG